MDEHTKQDQPRQVRMRYTGDGSSAAAGAPADPEHPEFWAHLDDAGIARLTGTGLYEHVGEYDADADERESLARGPEEA